MKISFSSLKLVFERAQTKEPRRLDEIKRGEKTQLILISSRTVFPFNLQTKIQGKTFNASFELKERSQETNFVEKGFDCVLYCILMDGALRFIQF